MIDLFKKNILRKPPLSAWCRVKSGIRMLQPRHASRKTSQEVGIGVKSWVTVWDEPTKIATQCTLFILTYLFVSTGRVRPAGEAGEEDNGGLCQRGEGSRDWGVLQDTLGAGVRALSPADMWEYPGERRVAGARQRLRPGLPHQPVSSWRKIEVLVEPWAF